MPKQPSAADDRNLYQVDGTWYLRVKIDGQPIRESLRTKDQAEAVARRDRRLAELRGHLHSWPEAVGKWLKEYLPDNVDDTTAQRYAVSIGQIAAAVVTDSTADKRVPLEELPVERIAHKTIGEIVNWSKQRRAATNATLRRDLTALSSVLHACVGWGWRDDNPARTWDRSHIKERREPITLPTAAEVERYCANVKPMWAALIRFLAATGMREAEAVGLTHPQIAADGSSIILTRTKGRRARVVPLSHQAGVILGGIPRHIKSQYVFWHDDGQPFRNVASRHIQIRNRINAAAKKADKGLEPLSFRLHDLRHLYAVNYLRDGGSIYDLQLILGHSSVKVTEMYLDYVDPVTRQRAMRIGGGVSQKLAQL
ncbi:tyrosine-type recombinase/integrase [Azospirillum argentinense]|uniref:Tyrosine-type recombinase/integrase n=1 Tax=Azospirillum argentinense TaxID=2970906 RepID=A0ABW8VE75_9PROT